MMENRQRQLASLQRMEEKIRSGGAGASGGKEEEATSSPASCPHHRMATHLLDICQAVSGHLVEWLPLPHHAVPQAPQESILYR